MTKEAIILAGGLGTRLRSVVHDVPKCMAPVGGRPFLHYIIQYLKAEGIEKFIFSLGYKSEVILEYLHHLQPQIDFDYTIEETPQGTGGGIRMAATKATEDNVIVCNGDTYFHVPLLGITEFHKRNQASCTLALKPMKDFNRYGAVEIDASFRIQSFQEKKEYKNGLINGGIYALSVREFLAQTHAGVFSFEADFLEKTVNQSATHSIYGYVHDSYFIDIGIPEDYARANKEMPLMDLTQATPEG